MNEFTKEELENILNGNIEIYPYTYSDLRNKIQHMIDTYCEHKQRQYYEHVPVYECKDCQMVSMIGS